MATLTHEAASHRAQAWLGAQAGQGLAISEWVVTEFSSALSIKRRTGQLPEQGRAGALAAFRALVAGGLEVAAVTSAHFRTAAQFADRHDLALRASDALHLAIAASRGDTVCTMDRRLGDAGPCLGVATLLV